MARILDEPRIDAVHHIGIAGLADADDAAVLDADIAFDDADDRVDDGDIAQQEIERTLGAGDTGGEPGAVTQRLAAAMQAFIAIDREVFLDDRDQRRVAQPDPVAGGRSIHRGIISA